MQQVTILQRARRPCSKLQGVHLSATAASTQTQEISPASLRAVADHHQAVGNPKVSIEATLVQRSSANDFGRWMWHRHSEKQPHLVYQMATRTRVGSTLGQTPGNSPCAQSSAAAGWGSTAPAAASETRRPLLPQALGLQLAELGLWPLAAACAEGAAAAPTFVALSIFPDALHLDSDSVTGLPAVEAMATPSVAKGGPTLQEAPPEEAVSKEQHRGGCWRQKALSEMARASLETADLPSLDA